MGYGNCKLDSTVFANFKIAARFCTYQQLMEKQEAKIANKYWRILDMAWESRHKPTHFNDSQKMNIATSKVIKLKLHVSVPGWPEKNLPKKNP